MAKVAVHNYLVWDHLRGRSVSPRMKATVERIEAVGGKIVPGTAEQVEDSALDGRSSYLPQAPAKQAAR